MMTPQIPAQGIILQHDYGDAKSYHIACECGCQTSDHDLWIEADDCGVTVNVSLHLKLIIGPSRSNRDTILRFQFFKVLIGFGKVFGTG